MILRDDDEKRGDVSMGMWIVLVVLLWFGRRMAKIQDLRRCNAMHWDVVCLTYLVLRAAL